MTDYSILRVYTETPSAGLYCNFGFYEDVPQPAGGSGWQGVPRPLNDPITPWRGSTDPNSMTLSLIMDSYTTDGVDIERDCRQLEKMYGAFVYPVTEPPLLVLDANGALQNDVINRPTLRWFIDGTPTYSDVLRNGSGRRVRQVVSIKFTRYVAYDSITRSVDTSQTSSRNTFIATQQVNTFKKAAAKYLKHYGGSKWANRLAQLNGARDGTGPLLPGRRYKLPTVQQIREWERTSRR